MPTLRLSLSSPSLTAHELYDYGYNLLPKTQLASGPRASTREIVDGIRIMMPALHNLLPDSRVAHYLFIPLAEAVVFAISRRPSRGRTPVPTLAKYPLHNHRRPADFHHSQVARNPFMQVHLAFERSFESVRTRYRAFLAARVARPRISLPADEPLTHPEEAGQPASAPASMRDERRLSTHRGRSGPRLAAELDDVRRAMGVSLSPCASVSVARFAATFATPHHFREFCCDRIVGPESAR